MTSICLVTVNVKIANIGLFLKVLIWIMHNYMYQRTSFIKKQHFPVYSHYSKYTKHCTDLNSFIKQAKQSFDSNDRQLTCVCLH